MSAGELILTDGLTKCAFVGPNENQSGRMGNSGNSAVTEFGPPLWGLRVETERLSLAQGRLWKAWFGRRRGRMYSFTAWSLFDANPQGVMGTADGSLGLTVDIPNRELDLTGVGAYEAKVGDMISYRTAANGFWCGIIQADVDAAGGNITVPVTPVPLAKHASAPAVRRVKALAEFELTTGIPDFDDYTDRRLSFEAKQILR